MVTKPRPGNKLILNTAKIYIYIYVYILHDVKPSCNLSMCCHNFFFSDISRRNVKRCIWWSPGFQKRANTLRRATPEPVCDFQLSHWFSQCDFSVFSTKKKKKKLQVSWLKTLQLISVLQHHYFLSLTLTHSLIQANADSQDEVDIQVLLWFQDFSLGNEGPVPLWDLRERRLQEEELLRRGKVTGSVVSPCLFQLRHPLPHAWNHPDPTGHQATSASRRQTEEVKLLCRLRQTAKRIQKTKSNCSSAGSCHHKWSIVQLSQKELILICSCLCYFVVSTVVVVFLSLTCTEDIINFNPRRLAHHNRNKILKMWIEMWTKPFDWARLQWTN